MAIHQYSLSFVPRNIVLEKYGCVPNGGILSSQERQDEEDGFDFDWWQNAVSVTELETAIHSIIPHTPETEFSSSLLHFGSYASHDASICFSEETGHVEAVGFRLDLTKNLTTLIGAILTFCHKFDLIILGEQDEVIEPTVQAVISSISHSVAYKFVLDPRGFIERIQ